MHLSRSAFNGNSNLQKKARPEITWIQTYLYCKYNHRLENSTFGSIVGPHLLNFAERASMTNPITKQNQLNEYVSQILSQVLFEGINNSNGYDHLIIIDTSIIIIITTTEMQVLPFLKSNSQYTFWL